LNRRTHKAAKTPQRVRIPHDQFNDPGQPKMLLTLRETAERLNISVTSVSRRVLTGEIPSIKIGSLRRVPVPQLERYLQQLVADQIPEAIAV
jgi:excisionase family DNA binding protein